MPAESHWHREVAYLLRNGALVDSQDRAALPREGKAHASRVKLSYLTCIPPVFSAITAAIGWKASIPLQHASQLMG
jgi:hypothetical protein